MTKWTTARIPDQTGRVAIVTGANTGLGLETAKALAAKGAHVVLAVRNLDKGKAAVDWIARSAPTADLELQQLDLGSLASVRAAADDLKGKFDRIDLLINNAGVTSPEAKLSQLTHADMARVFTTNTIGPAVLLAGLVPNLRAGQRKLAVNITSMLGSIGGMGGSNVGFSYAYCASKAALNMVTAKAARELQGDGITVVCICPGWNRTDMGGPNAPLDPSQGVASVIKTIDRLTHADTGRYLSHEGQAYEW